MALPNFDNIHPKIIEFTFSFPEFAPACKILIQPILESCDQAAHPYVNLCQHVKNQAISLICSGDMVD